jgi:hypothetical protein
MKLMDQDQSLHELLVEAADRVRLANDNLEATRYAYFESPTNANLRRLESAQREYLIAVEDRESLAEHISELEDWPHTEW